VSPFVSSRPTISRTAKPTTSTTQSRKPTIPSSNSITVRYIKISRVSQSPFFGDNFIHILGIDVFDINGSFISDQSTPTISNIYQDDSVQYGPQYLIDGVHQSKQKNGTDRIPHTTNDASAYMQLDFGKDVVVSTIVLWNHLDSGTNRIVGCYLSAMDNAGTEIFSQIIDTTQDVYEWEFGPRPRSLFRSTVGPIRSILGRCIDVYGRNFVSGLQLSVWDCNGTPRQLWVRPTSLSTDLRLQSSFNNLCMDVASNVGVDRKVILTTCDTESISQKWIYDGRNLRPQYNTGLCLNIQGNESSNPP